ncbi:uncharacterized protein LOC129778200 isoform X2 [Toxorhynchites rutilus septentrionalis]|uniref:uncharacterized protein LOC129778200 isoform X2 n=1 Tax=Toxorhynchites rutilus septentrionalis TaxID=329112 RepID=UPI002478AE4D|nr:uncharacterized protein LOC129778200 isoform X2 [Toxorhynchites rutilus septentrionalis]
MPVGGSSNAGQQSDEDDDFFKPTTNRQSTSKLSDRYGASSFRYVPPQEVIESGDESARVKTAVEWNLLQASVVTAYRLVDGENISQGRLGLALLRSDAEFRILLYRTKTDALATLNVSKSTKLFLRNDYLQFQSDDECFWSILFENDSELSRLLSTLDGACLLSGEKTQSKPIPASRSNPVIEEPNSDVDKSKANLISRMARVGQSIFPQEKQSFASEISDSSDTDTRIETIPRSNFSSHHRRVASSSKVLPVTIGMQMIPTSSVLTTADHNMMQTATDVNLNLFMTESRMQGTEMRMNLSKLEGKLDRMMDKIDNMQGLAGVGGKSSADKDEEMLALEEKILGLRKENHALKGTIRSLEERIMAHKANDLAEANLVKMEKRCQELEKTVGILQRDVQASHKKIDEDIKIIEEQSQTIEANREIMEHKTKAICTLEERLEAVQDEHNSELEKNKLLAEQLESVQKSMKDMEQELMKYKEDKSDNSTFDEMVKEIMNNCFQSLYEQIDDAKTIKIIGLTIRQETKAALERQKKK